jgi:hypothetical protein
LVIDGDAGVKSRRNDAQNADRGRANGKETGKI